MRGGTSGSSTKSSLTPTSATPFFRGAAVLKFPGGSFSLFLTILAKSAPLLTLGSTSSNSGRSLQLSLCGSFALFVSPHDSVLLLFPACLCEGFSILSLPVEYFCWDVFFLPLIMCPALGMVMRRWPVVCDRWAELWSGDTSSGRTSCKICISVCMEEEGEVKTKGNRLILLSYW